MLKNLFLFLMLTGFCILCQKPSMATDTNTIANPVVVELFTSQNCSSCPPADRLLNELAKNPNIISLGFHVTYWDHLAKNNTLSKEFSSKRQSAYAKSLKARNVYTPQMIVNGQREFVGSNKQALQNAIRDAQTLTPITIANRGNGALEIHLPQMPDDGYLNYTLTLFGTKNVENVAIRSGENSGKTVSYSNPVIYMQPMQSWIGNPERRVMSIPPSIELDSITVIAQAGNHGEIVAAGRL